MHGIQMVLGRGNRRQTVPLVMGEVVSKAPAKEQEAYLAFVRSSLGVKP